MAAPRERRCGWSARQRDLPVDRAAWPLDAERVVQSWYWNYPPYFEYTIVDLASGTAERVADLPRAAVQFSITLRVDGDNYVQLYDQDGGADVHRVDTDGAVTEVLASEPGTDVQYLGRL